MPLVYRIRLGAALVVALPLLAQEGSWGFYGGDAGGTRYSALKQINSTIKNISDSSAHLSEVATHADRVMASLDSRLSDATERLDKTLTRVDTALDTATGLMRTTQTVMNHNTFEIDRSLKQLNSATGNLDRTIDTISADPSVVIWGAKVNERENAK